MVKFPFSYPPEAETNIVRNFHSIFGEKQEGFYCYKVLKASNSSIFALFFASLFFLESKQEKSDETFQYGVIFILIMTCLRN